MQLDRATCKGCGNPYDESLNQDNSRPEDWEVVAHRCYACMEKAKYLEGDDLDRRGLLLTVSRKVD